MFFIRLMIARLHCNRIHVIDKESFNLQPMLLWWGLVVCIARDIQLICWWSCMGACLVPGATQCPKWPVPGNQLPQRDEWKAWDKEPLHGQGINSVVECGETELQSPRVSSFDIKTLIDLHEGWMFVAILGLSKKWI